MMEAWKTHGARHGIFTRLNPWARVRRGRRAGAAPTMPRSGRRRLLRRRARLALSVLLLTLLAWIGLETYRVAAPVAATWFQVRHVKVYGTSQVTPDEVIRHMKVGSGETLISLDVEQLAGRLQSHAWIKDATVTRIPLHTVAVHITEREPAAVLVSSGLNLLVDGDGRVLSMIDHLEDLDLPVLRGVDPTRLIHGEASPRRAVQAGVEVATLVQEVYRGPAEVDAGDPENFVVSVDGLRFEFGASSFQEKWELYRRIRPALQVPERASPQETVSEIDLRYPKKIIVRERG